MSSQSDYIYSAFFDREIAGYTFEAKGPNGSGYYRTRNSNNSIDPRQSDDHMDFIAAPKWMGSMPGYVFKMDDFGLGYYRDIPPVLEKDVIVKSGRRFSPLMSNSENLNMGINLAKSDTGTQESGAVCPFGFCKENRMWGSIILLVIAFGLYKCYNTETKKAKKAS